MIKKTITFKDLDGNDLTEDFYFALNTAEITEYVVGDDAMMQFFNRIAQDEKSKVQGSEVMNVFKKFITLSVGKRSEDGRRFIKSDEIQDDFVQTDAYPTLFMELVTDAESAAEFINGVVPGNLQDIVAKLPSETTDVQLPATTDVPAWIRQDRDPTDAELQSMSQAQLRDAFARREARARAQAATGIQ